MPQCQAYLMASISTSVHTSSFNGLLPHTQLLIFCSWSLFTFTDSVTKPRVEDEAEIGLMHDDSLGIFVFADSDNSNTQYVYCL